LFKAAILKTRFRWQLITGAKCPRLLVMNIFVWGMNSRHKVRLYSANSFSRCRRAADRFTHRKAWLRKLWLQSRQSLGRN
jgi:hypothetical protein